MERPVATLNWLRSEGEHAAPAQILEAASARLGSALQLGWFGPNPGGAEPVVVGGRGVGWVRAEDQADAAAPLVLGPVAAAVARGHDRRILAEEAKGESIALLIEADELSHKSYERRAREAGLRVDARHVLACIIAEPVGSSADVSPLIDRRAGSTIAHLALREQLKLSESNWLITRIGDDLALLWSQQLEGEIDIAPLRVATETLMRTLAQELPGRRFYGGIGSVGSGPDGLRTSAIRSASRSPRTRKGAGVALQIGGSELLQLLGDLAASPVTRRVFDDVLAPFADLSDPSIQPRSTP